MKGLFTLLLCSKESRVQFPNLSSWVIFPAALCLNTIEIFKDRFKLTNFDDILTAVQRYIRKTHLNVADGLSNITESMDRIPDSQLQANVLSQECYFELCAFGRRVETAKIEFNHYVALLEEIAFQAPTLKENPKQRDKILDDSSRDKKMYDKEFDTVTSRLKSLMETTYQYQQKQRKEVRKQS